MRKSTFKTIENITIALFLISAMAYLFLGEFLKFSLLFIIGTLLRSVRSTELLLTELKRTRRRK
jgi:hypothetical protein